MQTEGTHPAATPHPALSARACSHGTGLAGRVTGRDGDDDGEVADGPGDDPQRDGSVVVEAAGLDQDALAGGGRVRDPVQLLLGQGVGGREVDESTRTAEQVSRSCV